jgi:hypothetical protein
MPTNKPILRSLKIVSARVLDDHTLSLRLSNGLTVERDLSPLVRRAKGLLRHLRDPSIFRRVRVVEGALTWPGEIDICPLATIYGKNWLHSRAVPRSLSI